MASSPLEKIDTSLPASGQSNQHWPEDLQPDGVCSEPDRIRVYTKLNECNFTKRCVQIIDHLTYLALTLVGVYFIIEGKVIPNFQSGKTNYALYSEPITEFPTILTHIDHVNRSQYKYGIDFNISVGEWLWNFDQGVSKSLTFGENLVPGGRRLKVEFEAIVRHFYKITPISFSLGMQPSYFMKYTFKNEDDTFLSNLLKVGAILTAENNSVPIPWDWNHFDGKINLIRLGLGEQGFVTITPRKKINLSGTEGCRKVPHNEIMLRKIVKQLPESCSKPCLPHLGKRLVEMHKHLPTCQSKEDNKCAWNATFTKAIQIGEKKIKKPCQTLEYNADMSISSELPKNQIQFLFRFQYPAQVNVEEEYLIYDTVNLISSIGGTVGFCIGLSFYTLTTGLMTWLQLGIKRILVMKQRRAESSVKIHG